jgi:hypothetical protein
MPHFKDSQNNVHWLDDGDDAAVWLPNCTPITDAEAEELRAKTTAVLFNNLSYAQKRMSEYPSIGDQMDALWKGGDVAAEMLAQIQAVKAKYPKGA